MPLVGSFSAMLLRLDAWHGCGLGPWRWANADDKSSDCPTAALIAEGCSCSNCGCMRVREPPSPVQSFLRCQETVRRWWEGSGATAGVVLGSANRSDLPAVSLALSSSNLVGRYSSARITTFLDAFGRVLVPFDSLPLALPLGVGEVNFGFACRPPGRCETVLCRLDLLKTSNSTASAPRLAHTLNISFGGPYNGLVQ